MNVNLMRIGNGWIVTPQQQPSIYYASAEELISAVLLQMAKATNEEPRILAGRVSQALASAFTREDG